MRERVHLSTQLAIAITALVVITAVSIGYLGYRNIASVAVERTLIGLDANAQAQAGGLSNLVRSAAADLKGFRRIVGLDELIALTRDPSLRSIGGHTLQEWRSRIGEHLMVELATKPDFIRYRLIAAAGGGREVLRVERRQNGDTYVVQENELNLYVDRNLVDLSLRVKDGEVIISPVELDRTNDGLVVPNRPVICVITPVYAADGTWFGLLVARIDLSLPFQRLANLIYPTVFYLVNERGDYLLHPDKSREFSFETGKPFRIQDDYPQLAAALRDGSWSPKVIEDREGRRFGVAFEPMRFAGRAPLAVVEMLSEQEMTRGPMLAWLRSTLIGGTVAVLIAVLLAIVFARSLTRPLSQMTRAVAGFTDDRPIVLPLDAGGEIGLLARAFKTMVQASRTKTSALEREKEIFESIMNAMAESVLLLDAGGKVIYENAALLAHRRPPEGVPMLPWEQAADAFQTDGVTPLPQAMRPGIRALQGESIDRFEMVVHLRQNGKVLDVVGSARPIRGADGRINGSVAVFSDITEIRETHRRLHQAQKLEAIGQLTGGVAHDFNNMLTVISGTAEILLDELADRPNLLRIAKLIDQAAERGADLTRQLLAFARKQPLEPRSVDINAVVESIEQLLCSALGEQVAIELRLGEDVDAAHVDPSQLSSALLNLAVNARDAMPDGGTLRIETTNVTFDKSDAEREPELLPGRYVAIAVSDTGSGIPPQVIDKVFEPFFTTKGVGKGTGLGLSMVYGFVKQSGGHINIVSEEGRGTTITLFLPRAAAEPRHAETPDPAECGSETILLVEDDSLVRSFAVAQLQGLGYRVIAVADGSAALAEVKRGTAFDLLLTDVVMPGGINGRQLADAIARLRPVRVLFTSGYSENSTDQQRRLAQGVLLLGKPYRRAELARLVRAALERDVHVPNDAVACSSAVG